ncbi:S-layer family duplication domain protein [Methanosarcina lacustris Z-7289]|uniref:S-layer family duplication domain protein n=1 Tax=Methanosarcina lacustris Z-7289 TaxID=1434111 RepID=A0A0E3WSG0_9EURY|nr:S-layer family duplication domain protein [Methanosarcina lacustris Z-7289]
MGDNQTFSITTNENATVMWNEDGMSISTSTDASNVATLPHVIKSGSYHVTASIDGVGLISDWTVTGAAGSVADFEANNTAGSIPLTVAFKDRSINATDWQWSFGDESSNSTQNPVHTYTTAGNYTVTLNATINGTTDTEIKENYIKVSPQSVPTADFEADVKKGPAPLTVKFTDTSPSISAASRNWNFGDGTNNTEPNPTHIYTNEGKYKVTLSVTDAGGKEYNVEKENYIEVQSKTASSGNRIWEEGKGMNTTYTWDAQSFSGFFYDLDTGVSSEEMTITDIGRNINEGDIEYSTKPTKTDFEYRNWGSYQVIGFMAEKYFAGYSKENSTVIGDDISPISDGILAKILIDNDDKKSAYSGEALALEDGYSLNIVEVDVNGNTVWVQLEKDGKVVDDNFITSGQDYVYKTALGDSEDVPIIIAHFGTVFAGAETSAVFIQGLFQISDNYMELTNGDSYGEMEVTSLSSSEIRMKNTDDVSLDKGDTIDLMGKIQLQVADDNTLRFAPVLDTTEEGTYELRGTVYDKDVDSSLPTWTPYNFEGFYYNIDEGIGTEQLEIKELNGREIPSDKLVYQSSPQPVEFEHSAWGNFTVVGFMAEKYFAGYPDDTADGQINDVSLLSNDILAKVLTDSDDKESMYSGSALVLEEGYSLNIKEVDVNGNTVWVQLEKDGKVVDDQFITSGQDYIYETTLGKTENVPLIIVHFGTVFAGAETSAVFTQGIFQISDDYIEINNGDTFGEMEITGISESGITMKNNDDIGLGKDDTVDIMGDVKFKTANSDTLRFYPFVEVESGGKSSKALKIGLPDEIVVGDTIDIEVTAGNESIEGATVKVNATSAGKTDVDGIVKYTAEEAGTFKVTAEKDGYTTANENVKVIPPKEKMSLNISPETVYKGDTITIQALKTIGGDPIEGSNVSINGKVIGETNSNGTLTYNAKEIGKFKISATREGFLDKSVEVNVKDYEAIFEFSNLVIDPIEVSAGKEATITIDAENTGNAAGNYSLELVVNGSSADSQPLSLDVGENKTVTFKHSEEEPGSYTVEVGGQEATYTVKEKSSILLYALITIILLLGGGIAYMFTKGGWDVKDLQAKVEELMKSANLKK